MSRMPRPNDTTQSTQIDPKTGTRTTITRTNVTEVRPSGGTCPPTCGPPPGPVVDVPPAVPVQSRAPKPSGIGSARGPNYQYYKPPRPPIGLESTRFSRGTGAVSHGKSSAAHVNQVLNLPQREVAGVQYQVGQQLFEKYKAGKMKKKAYAKGKDFRRVAEDVIPTPAGIEPVIQQTYIEKRVEKAGGEEKVVKNISVTHFGNRVTMSEQQIDPDFAMPSRGRDTVSIKETIAVTPSYTTTAKDIRHERIKPKAQIDLNALAHLVQEETQDVEDILKMAPPDLPLNPEKYPIKKRLEQLRLNYESMILLEKSFVHPSLNADEEIHETPPEALVKIMHTVEAGVKPQGAPDVVFNTLFEERGPQHSVGLSSIGPGPLQDVVVPQNLTKDIHKEAMTADLNKLTEKMKNSPNVDEIPTIDIFTRLMDEEGQKTVKQVPGTAKPFKPIGEEEMPWGDDDIEPIVNIVGAEPVEILDPINIDDLEQSGKLQEELANGIEYFVDADPVQYVSKVQLRGSHPPPWFPGYIYALPEFQDVVKLAKCPGEVLYASWRSGQPKIIPEHSLSILL